MCGIAICPKRDLVGILSKQQDRGLDSMGIISGKNIYSLVGNYFQYKKVIKKKVYKDDYEELCIMHTRKASVGVVNEANSHPFISSRFLLVQNGTSRALFNKYKEEFPFETDSEVLLNLIDKNCNSLGDVPDYLKELSKDVDDKFGVIIMQGRTTGNILFWTDGDRETFIDSGSGHIKSIRNYEYFAGFENKGFILMEPTGKVISTDMEDVNKDRFIPKATFYLSPKAKKPKNDVSKRVYAPHNVLQREREMEYYPDSTDDYNYRQSEWEKEDMEALNQSMKNKKREQNYMTQDEYNGLKGILTTEEERECDVALEFFVKNMNTETSGLTYEDHLKWYLKEYYGCSDANIYFISFGGHFPEEGFRLAYDYMYDI